MTSRWCGKPLLHLCQPRAGYRAVVEGTTALPLIQSEMPDIAVLYLNLRYPSTLDIVRKLRETQTQARIVEEANLKGKASLVNQAGMCACDYPE
jgi:ActR/RegA family two-component response regulator